MSGVKIEGEKCMLVYLQMIQWCFAIIEIFLCYCFIDLLGGEKFLRKNIVSTVVCSIIIGTLLAFNRYNTILLSWFMLILQSVLIFISLLKKKIKDKVLLGGITIAFNICIAFFQMFFAFMIMSITKNVGREEVYVDMSVYRIYCYLLSIIMCTIILGVIFYTQNSDSIKMELYKHSLFFFSIAGILGIAIFQGQMNAYGKEKSLKNTFLLFLVIAAIIFFLITSIRGARKTASLDMQKEINKMTESNYIELRNMYENYSCTYHDMKNHLIVIEGYCETGENEKALQYIQKLQNPIKTIEKYIESGNEIIDVILNSKIAAANKKGIHTDAAIDKIDKIYIEENDLCAILSNMIDNAIEACELITTGEKWIRICVKLTETVFMIKISNSYSDKYKGRHAGYTTLKKGFHGYGIKSIKARVDKYGGTAEWGYEGTTFTAVAMFFL